jgi:hypothetical protein
MNSNPKNNICPKGGIKIYNTSNNDNNNNKNRNNDLHIDQNTFFNNLKNQNKPTGVRITNSNNEYNIDPFEGLNPFTNSNEERNVKPIVYDNKTYHNLDLNIDNYSREDLYNLFGLVKSNLSEENMRESKKTVLKTHPDKSRLDPKYFLFFSKAYKRLHSIYEFQNKNTNKKIENNEYFNSDNTVVLDKMFEQDKHLKNPKNFNQWFNDQFEKHKINDESDEKGYGSWLKSDEDIVFTPNVTKSNMAIEMEKRKKQVQTLTTYNGVTDYTAASLGGSSLMDYNSNFTSGTLFSNEGMGYTDLRQAYVESVIPVTEEDYQKMTKFNNLEEYKYHRNNSNTKPLDKEESMKQLYHQNQQKDEESAALAFYYAQQSEKTKQKQESFWSGLKQLTNH